MFNAENILNDEFLSYMGTPEESSGLVTARRKVIHPLNPLPSHTQTDTYLSINLLKPYQTSAAL